MGLLDRYSSTSTNEEQATQSAFANHESSDKIRPALEDRYSDVKARIHSMIIEQQLGSDNADVSEEGMRKLIDEYVERPDFNIPRVDRETVKKELFDDIMGFGPIQPLIDSDKYSEIMVNGYDHVYVESKGKLVLTDIQFKDNYHLMQIVDRIVSKVGRHVDESSPMCDARLLDGSRVNVIIPPLSLIGPILTIRKFGKTPITADNLVKWGSVSPKMLEFLEAAVKGKLNIIVSGGTGSGKTTLLNCISTIDKVTAGHIYVDGKDITKIKGNNLNRFRREELGFIFQDFNLIDTLTAYENIALALSIQNVKPKEIEKRVNAIADKLGIDDVLKKYSYQMSGGQKQRVAAARALITNPKLVLADEPTGALDSKSARQLLESMKHINELLSATILMVTHDAFTASYASRVIFIKDGKIFNELRKGDNSRKEFFDRIIDVVTMLGGSLNDAL